MVTTIKITCDGVFIQSNSFLTSSSHPTAGSLHSPDSTTATDSNSTLSNSTNSSLLSNTTFNGDKDKSVTSILDYDKHHKITSSNSNSATRSSSCQKTNSTNTTSRAKRPRTPKCDNRRRYYFGSNKIYWCKQSVDRLSSSGCCYKSDLGVGRNSSSSLQRSASSVTHKELQQHKSHSYTGRSKHKPLTASTSLSAVPSNHHQHNANQKPHSNYLNTFYNLNKCHSSAIKTSTPKTISGATSIFLVNGFSVNSPAYNNNNKCYAPDTRLLSFLRSARKLYRNSVRVNNNSTNQQDNIFNNGNTSSAENTKVSYDKCNSTNNINLNKTKNCLNENVTETKSLNNNSSSSSLADKIKQTYIFGVKSFSSNNNSDYNYLNSKNKSNNNKNIENNTTLCEEWFG